MSIHRMNPGRRQTLHALGASALYWSPARAQDTSTASGPLRLLVGYPPGGGGDMLARTLSKRLSAVTTQPVIVENKPGAGGTLAASTLTGAPSDGSVVYMADSSILVAQSVYEKLGYDPQTLTPVLGTGQLAYCVVVHPSFPARTVAEFIQVLKAAPGKYSYASPGVGNIAHLGAESFKHATGIDMVHVPYKGGAPALTDLISGLIPILFISLPPAMVQAQAGKLRIMAVMSSKRWETLPAVPALSETLPGFEAVTNMFVVAPPKTPQAAVDRLAALFRSALSDAELRQTYLAQGAMVEIRGPDELSRQISAELKRWPELAKRIGLRPGAL